MRALTVRTAVFAILALLPLYAYAADVTVSGSVSFVSLDGGPDDADHTVNGVFTVSGNLIVNGTINCNDSGGHSACPMTFQVGGNMTMNAGSGLFAENRTGAGDGGAITLNVGGNLLLHGSSLLTPGAIISTHAEPSANSNGADVVVSVGGTVVTENGSVVDVGSRNAHAGRIHVVSGGPATIGGALLSGPGRTILPALVLDGGGPKQRGGEVTVRSSSFAEPAVTIDSHAVVLSQSNGAAAGPVTVEGCGIVVRGFVEAVGGGSVATRVAIRSGRSILIDGRDFGVIGAMTGRNGHVGADAIADDAAQNSVGIFAGGEVDVLGPDPAHSLLYAVSGLGTAAGGGSAIIHVISLGDAVTVSGNAVSASNVESKSDGGEVQIAGKGNLNLDQAVIRASGDFVGSSTSRHGGSIDIRSLSGNVIWTNGTGDVRPTGSAVPASVRGTIAISACGTINTAGSTFPVNGSPVGPFPTTATGVCSPAAPSLPGGEPALPVCNNPPVPVSQSVTTLEDQSVTITMTATDPDSNPVTFTIDTPPAHGTVSAIFNATPTSAQVTYTPAADYNGSDSFVFKADDGNGGTATATVSIAITPVNDAPSFNVGSSPQVSLEDAGPQFVSPWSSGISAGPADEQASQHVTLTITGNSNPSLFSAGPSVTPSGALTYTAAPNAYGSASLSVVAHDDGGTANGGVDTSAAQNFTITIVPVNDPPSFTKGADVTVNEDSGAYSQPSWATSISAGPNETQTVNFVVSTNNGALFSAPPAVAADGTLTFTPAANANGSATVTVVAHDNGGTANGGVDTSAAQSYTITVTAVNDPPSFTAGANVAVIEDSGPHSAVWATAISAGPADESGQTVTFAATNDNNALFSVQPSIAANGTLTFTPAADANGTAVVTVAAQDNGGTANGGNDTSASQTFTIAVIAVNDPPSFTKGADQTALEDAGAQTVAGWATAMSGGPANESTQTVSFTATNDNNALFSVQPAVAANGTLTYTSAPDANGTATVTVQAHDDGGSANSGVDTSASQTFTITITAVNDPPSFTAGGNAAVLEDSGPYSAAWATAISAGPADESSQTVTFTATNDNNALFSVQPSIASNGALTFTPAADANGTATVTVTAHDNGGTANGGNDTSTSQAFVIAVTAVNDPPSFTKGADQTALEDAGAQTVAGWATSISAGPANESAQTVSFTASNDNNALFSSQPAVAANGTLTYTSAPNANGTATVTVAAHDAGGTANGGVDTSASQTFTITITAVNDPPSFTAGGTVTVLEDSGSYSAAWASAISAGPADESSQAVTFTATNDNSALFSGQPSIASDGTLTFTPAADANGTATVTVTAHDNGGTANGGNDTSAPQTFIINVTPVNDAPSFVKGADQSVVSDAGPQSVPNWATSISAGPANESAQLVSFVVTNDNNGVFTVQPTVSSTGTLMFTIALAAPTAIVHVYVSAHDNGGTANGGVDTSAAQTFAINVTHANQPPVANPDSFDAVGNTELAVGTAGTQAASLAATGSVLANDSDPDGDSLTAALGTITAGASVTMNADGSFTYLPPAGFAGDDTFTYIVSDGHGHNVNGTVTIHVINRVLYVRNNGGGSTGRIDSPYATLAAAQAASADNDTVYVFTGDGTATGQNAGFTLNHDGERLIGEGIALTVPGTYNTTANPQLRAAATAPSISNASGVAVSVAKSGTVATAEVSGISVTGAGTQGVQINDATNVTMRNDTIASAPGSGIKGTKVVGFTLTNTTITGAGVSGVAFDDAASVTNLSGAVTITNNIITNPAQHGISILNFDGTIGALTITGNNLTSTTSAITSVGSGISIVANRGATTGAQIAGGSISGNTITNFPNGAGIQIIGGNSAAGPAVAIASLASPLLVQDNTISGASAAAGLGTNGISTTIGHQSSGYFTIGASGHPNAITNVRGSGIACSLFGAGTEKCAIAFNTIVANNTAGSAGINTGAGQALTAAENGTLYLDIHDNNVSKTVGNGILATIRSVSSSGIFHIQNNVVAAPTVASGTIYGIRVDSGNGTGSSSVCLKIAGNTTAGSTNGTTTAPGIGLRVQHTGTVSTMTVDGLTPSPASDGGPMETYVGNSGQNPGSANGTFGTTGVSSISGGATFTASSCTIP